MKFRTMIKKNMLKKEENKTNTKWYKYIFNRDITVLPRYHLINMV